MSDHVYKIVEVVGSSEKGVDDAIQTAIARASKSLDELRWFEVVQIRGMVEAGRAHYFQVTLKLGFTIADTE
jgi:flavin-binding protein dodecin